MLVALWGIKKKYTVFSKICNLVRNMKTMDISELRAVNINIFLCIHICTYTRRGRRVYTHICALQNSALLIQHSDKCLGRREGRGASEKTKLYHGKEGRMGGRSVKAEMVEKTPASSGISRDSLGPKWFRFREIVSCDNLA